MNFATLNGSSVQCGAILASAGEGTIYEVVGHPALVAKVFHADLKDLDIKLAKVEAMIASTPDGAVQSDGFVVLTWPTDLIRDGTRALGYLMPRIDTSNAVEIHTVSNPSNRTNPLPNAPIWTANVTWSHLVNVAANLCLAVEIVHLVNAVIGDFQERNILVNDTTRVTLVDCDSMQFTDEAGRQFPCGVARPEFTAPELSGVDLATTARSKPSDLFALAVHIHLLLMAGNHPFLRGEWTGVGEQPDALTLAASGQWAGGPGSVLHTHPLAPPVSFLPHGIQHLFVRAFTDGARNPDARPTAQEWRAALLSLRMGTCPRGHQIPVDAQPCPWCAIDDQRVARRSARAAYSSGSVGARANQVVYRVDSSPYTPPTQQLAPTAVPYPTGPAAVPYPAGPAAVPYPTGSGGGSNRNLVIVVGIAAVALIGLLLVFLIPSGKDRAAPTTPASSSPDDFDTGSTVSSTTTWSTVISTVRAPSAPPADAKPCSGNGMGMYRNAARGTEITSCPFAISVRDAVNNTRQATPARVDAFSPVTKKWYPMTCAVEMVLTCRGGNDAVVYVY